MYTARSLAIRLHNRALQGLPRSRTLARSAELNERLQSAVASEDWLAAVEVMTEARILKTLTSMDSGTVSETIALCASSNQMKKAMEYAEFLIARGAGDIKAEAVAAILSAFLRADAKEGLAFFDKLVAAGYSLADAGSAVRNRVVRVSAKADDIERALTLLEEMERNEEHIEGQTFDYAVMMCLRAKMGEKAEEIMEMKDFA